MDEWLDDDFQNQQKIVMRIKTYFNELKEEEVQRFLFDKGLYRPNQYTWNAYLQLRKGECVGKGKKIVSNLC